ncbi:hypothetical protein LEL_05509 [Akanthomyces lecanii RCEF 1005]|uniref:Uncharacterized protein n=1 Tax=Akanthomyces lecanii RCEF 1005 TaxID=1081108 RepID=A0A168I3D5_CORDF|nr:hypothetical protein LEL_05509 [Akanthomyces lecanii RCEF 1005]
MTRQNTFTVIPQAPRFDADTAAPARPMTSKQVRKAYKAATKTPTMTRADRVKWEREEQERIKKEFEKEKVASKARAAREKKKEKEIQQREEKRRNGLPLVNVRPSQDTIARFVRGNGSKKKRDAEGVVVTAAEEVLVDEPEEQRGAGAAAVGASAIALGSVMEAEEYLDENTIPEDITSDRPPLPNIDNKAALPNIDNKTTEHSVGADNAQIPLNNKKLDETNTQEGLDVAPEDYDVDLSLEKPIDEASFDVALDTVAQAELPKISSAGPPADDVKDQSEQSQIENTNYMPSQDLLDEEINTDMLEELDELLSGGKTPAKLQPVRLPSSGKYATRTPPIRNISHREPRIIPEHESTSPRQEQTISPSQRQVQIQLSPERPRQTPPLGTQAILVNCDDFFPTSSQQLRELDDEQEPSHDNTSPQRPSHNIQGCMTPGPNIQPQNGSRQPTVSNSDLEMDSFESEFGSFPSTAHLSLLECSTTPLQPPRHPPQIHANTSSHRAEPVAPHPPQSQPSRFFTSSGSREQLSLALQRSRRSAALEQIQEKERQRQEAGLVMRQSKYDEARRSASPTKQSNAPEQGNTTDKENVPPPEMRCSQETEYGGEWVEDAAWDLALC